MHWITGTHIDRRTFLRGMGATVALPFLDAMVPAGPLLRRFMDAEGSPTRLVAIEFVHGMAGLNQEFGAKQHLFSPAQVGRGFELLEENALKPLEAWREYLTVVSNTDCRMAEAYRPEEIGGDHFRSSAVFLTQSHPKQTQGSDLYVGTSLDQIQAQRFGQQNALPSLQLCIESMDQAGGCDYNYSCAYTDSISWSSPDEPLPMIRNPRVAFDLLFGAGGTSEERSARRKSHRSILDWIVEEVAELKRELGAEDRARMDRYLENVREIERRIQRVEALNTSGRERELPEAPAGVPDSYEEHMQLMFDLQVLAFETDMTRVISFKTGRDASNRAYPESGSDRAFHPASHHGNNPEAVMEFNRINRYHVSMLPYFLERLRNTVEGDTHLLDKTVIVYGSPMGDPNVHNHRRCPLVLLGKGNGILEGDLHLRAADGTPMANAFLTLLHGLGHDLESFGDSTGHFPLTYPSGLSRLAAQDR
jgi:hypothetical protein